MKHKARLIRLLLTLALLPLATGCGDDTKRTNGSNDGGVDPLTRFEGAPQVETAAYAPGKHIRVESANGRAALLPGSSPTELTVTFGPFSMRPASEEALAAQDIAEGLTLTVDDSGPTILIQVTRAADAHQFLGADIEVALPSGFDGGIEADQQNGPVDADLTECLAPMRTIPSPSSPSDSCGAVSRTTAPCMVAVAPLTNTPTSWLCSTSELRSTTVEFVYQEELPWTPMPRPNRWSDALGRVRRTTVPSMMASEPPTKTPTPWLPSTTEVRSVASERAPGA